MYQAVSEAVAASLAGATLGFLDSRNYQEGLLHRAPGLGVVDMMLVTDSHATDQC
jgi:hypothetical protein